MRYEFKPHVFGRNVRVEVTADSIKVLDAQGRQKRKLAWTDLTRLQVYDRGVAVDPKRGKFTMVDFILKPRFGGRLRICSASYLAPGRPIEATDQSAAFGRLYDTVKHRVSAANPDVPLIIGSRAASLAFAVVTMMGLGLCVFAVFAAVTSNNPLSEIWVQLLLMALVGVVISSMTVRSAVAYWPSSQSLGGDRS